MLGVNVCLTTHFHFTSMVYYCDVCVLLFYVGFCLCCDRCVCCVIVFEVFGMFYAGVLVHACVVYA